MQLKVLYMAKEDKNTNVKWQWTKQKHSSLKTKTVFFRSASTNFFLILPPNITNFYYHFLLTHTVLTPPPNHLLSMLVKADLQKTYDDVNSLTPTGSNTCLLCRDFNSQLKVWAYSQISSNGVTQSQWSSTTNTLLFVGIYRWDNFADGDIRYN